LNEPGAEPGFRAKLPQIFESLEDGLLGNLFGISWIVHNGNGGSPDSPLVRPDELVEKLMLPISDAPNQDLFA
jgi:hypothetical protein